MMDKQVRNSLGSRAYFPFPMQALNFRKLNIEREAKDATLQESKRP
jgi:hypothetical protein